MLMMTTDAAFLSPDEIIAAANRAAQAIPPLWPLASSVAVNPFLGQTGEPLPTAAARLRRVAGISLTMPRYWYAGRLQSGDINEDDLQAAFDAAHPALRPASLVALKLALKTDRIVARAHPTVANLSGNTTGLDWPNIVNGRISHWASGFFDKGQALWALPEAIDAYASWKAYAIHDLTPEIAGLRGFAQTVANSPTTAEAAIVECVNALELSGAALEIYFHRLLMSLGGWSQVARYRLWQSELKGAQDDCVTDLLAIRMIWEAALLEHYRTAVEKDWQSAVQQYAEPVHATIDDGIDAILQEAAERGAQRKLQRLLAGTSASQTKFARPALQVAFCIDVRSEVFRRGLETLDPGIQTLGFAGFFGLGIGHRRFASDVVEAHLPVLLTPGVFTRSGDSTPARDLADLDARIRARAKRAWGRFKLAAISSFAFVEAAGPIYAAKLIGDGLGLKHEVMPHDPAPCLDDAVDLEQRIGIAHNVLKAMSLTQGFARLVLLAGHGANVTNNPHASALHCGACGGYSGEVNARLLASLLNDRDVRTGLGERGIVIPVDTLFVGALHDTTTDAVTVFAADHPSTSHAADLEQVKQWLASAGALARAERAMRLSRADGGKSIAHRARDWAELRPEWALAGCQAFIAAPRSITSGRDLAGRAFLHDYDWRRDEGFGVLDLILTAPVVVASWISLQYYGSTVAPDVFGAGNKLLHNVTGGIGVVEGNGGLLRTGLPWQSVYDGKQLMHEPLRLSVLVNAPREAIGAVLERHPQVRALFDNRWLHLFAMDDEGHLAWRYKGDLNWEECGDEA
jgi:hypothetical protein